jgi:hypothetical protein
MRLVTLLVLVLGMTASAYAVTPSTGNVFQMEQKPAGQIYQNPEERVTGDTVGDPFIMDAIPFNATGTTCGFVNDYDGVCPFSGSTSPDVVYKYVCGTSMGVTIDLCASTYDTKVYVFENTVGNMIACNDDFCSWQSYIGNAPFTAGNTYYIIVDGYGGSCGNYVMAVTEYEACTVECPAGAMPEGEPDCYTGYNDTYNGGCNVTPFPVFQVLEPSCDPIVICGTTGVFLFGSSTYRDTDWFEINLTAPANICLGGDSEVPTYFFIIDGRAGCDGSAVIANGIAGPCAPISGICNYCDVGTWWTWAGPNAWDFSYVCGSVYWQEITGYDGGASPAENTTWGSIKNLFN